MIELARRERLTDLIEAELPVTEGLGEVAQAAILCGDLVERDPAGEAPVAELEEAVLVIAVRGAIWSLVEEVIEEELDVRADQVLQDGDDRRVCGRGTEDLVVIGQVLYAGHIGERRAGAQPRLHRRVVNRPLPRRIDLITPARVGGREQRFREFWRGCRASFATRDAGGATADDFALGDRDLPGGDG